MKPVRLVHSGNARGTLSSRPLRDRSPLRMVTRLVAMGTALAVAGAAGAVAFAADGEAVQGRVLQSVAVQMTPDGTLSAVDSSVLYGDSQNAQDAEEIETALDPGQVTSQLPVRVMTAYRTDKRAGTDLSDLEGYSGEITIDVTVQNLTVKPELVSYDVDGRQREQLALVGAPLTVVAAAGLGDLPADAVVTAGASRDARATNGVLGKGKEGETQVQWATILAPPQLDATARFSLVVDAKDFSVPDFDISVQPGLVTDPSLGALVDSAFNPEADQELKLQRKTVAVIGRVNGVLANAGTTMSEIREILGGSAETIGERTVSSLQASTRTVTTSMESLGSSLDTLKQQISGNLKSTESVALQELKSAVATVDTILGDTSSRPGRAPVTGNGCSYRVDPGGEGRSLYDSMITVASQLNGYADANSDCRSTLIDTIRTTIGPEQPTAQTCATSVGSVSCSLQASKEVFGDVAESLQTLTADATQLLNPENYSAAAQAAAELRASTMEVRRLLGSANVGGADPGGAVRQAQRVLSEDLRPAMNQLASLNSEIYSAADAAARNLGIVRERQAEAVAEVCKLAVELPLVGEGGLGEDVLGDLLPRQRADRISGLLSGKACDNGTLPEDVYPENSAEAALSAVNDNVATIGTKSWDIGERLGALSRILDRVDDALVRAGAIADNGQQENVSLAGVLYALGSATDDLNRVGRGLDDVVGNLNQDFGLFEERLAANVGDKAAQIEALSRTIDPEIEKVAKAGARSRAEIDNSFQISSTRMTDLANRLAVEGRAAVNKQKNQFAVAQRKASDGISEGIQDGLSRINKGVGASTRNMSSATSMLTADLRRVLLDLGTRKPNGGGLLGAMTTSAQSAKSADYQLAQATQRSDAFANVRTTDIAGIKLRQAQTEAAMARLADLPAVELELAPGTTYRSIYHFRIGDGQ